MKVPLSWLKQYLDLSLSIKDLVQTLTLAGLEVEGIQHGTDPVLDISLTPNLGHCLSIYGIARELSSLLQIPLKSPAYLLKENPSRTSDRIKISLVDKRHCSRYACRLVQSVKVGPSPAWLQERLHAIGVRSINNVIDIGNYVMFDRGQPLHLFDYHQIANHELIITSQTAHTTLKTLDGIEREIPPTALLICDPLQPHAFAGIMGGDKSAISEQTVDVLIEAALFNSASIRKTSKLLNLRSDSSYRFERNVDPSGQLEALDMAAYLLQEIAGGSPCQGAVDLKDHEIVPKTICCRLPHLNRILGTQLSLSEVVTLFERLHFTILSEETHSLTLSIPTYRQDIASEIDLIEEVARLYGYQNFPVKTPVHIDSNLPHDPRYLLENACRSRLIGQGLKECITCNLIGPRQVDAYSKELISVLHPHSVDQSILRPSLLPGLAQVVLYHLNRFNPQLQAFEIGTVHCKIGGQYQESMHAGIILTGNQTPYHFDPKPREVDFFDLKGIVENFIHPLPLTLMPSHLSHFHPGRQASLFVEQILIGTLGQLHPDYTLSLGITERVYFAEINLDELRHLLPTSPSYPEPCAFPGSERDWTITLADHVPIGRVLQALKQHAPSHLEHFFLLDLYKSPQIGKDRKNATFRFYYRDKAKTIDFDTVEQEHTQLIQSATQEVLL